MIRMPRGTLAAFALLLSLASSLGCAATFSPTPVAPDGNWGDILQAGVAQADITPPPGLSLFGHGPEGRVSVGVLLRLYCKAFVFTRGEEIIALVPCDLGAPSLELQRSIAQRLVHGPSPIPIGADRLLLMATHTHAGPAHYFGPRQYGGGFSSREPGFDPTVRDFLADRIATAVRVAYHKRVPARVGWISDEALGLTYNRSFTPFAANFTDPKGLKWSHLLPK